MEFADFFIAVHGEGKEDFEPFPWQTMLAKQVAETRQWPQVIDLPTASGKTAVIDIAVWHLAQQAGEEPHERTAPRRIWFVVDRRIVVDEAYERAKKIADWLDRHRDSEIAKALFKVSGFDGNAKVPPLSYGRLRGGILQDSGWATFPSQPAILTSTVDQFGSRLLFRGYGMGPGMWPIHAALAGNDSLLVLDEAHLAEPLMQTLDAFRRYRGQDWCEQPIALPWQMTRMSATPPPGAADRFPIPQQRAAALDHPLLDKRTKASKGARLVPVMSPKAGKRRPATACAPEAVEAVVKFVADGRQRVAVMMNRVDTAVAVHEELSKRDDIDALLLTGRMRPFDRDELVNRWVPLLKSDSDEVPEKQIVLVTTQCLEVGADFSFDALVTECASLDALRQRFGRLDRLGELGQSKAAVLAWHGDVPDEDQLDDSKLHDPIYGNALARTWHWLNVIATEQVVDFGIAAMDAKLTGVDLLPMLPPRPDAPVLLPAYLDAWCQTGPRPHVEADLALFLHGQVAEQPDVQVAFRQDLTDELNAEQWAEIVRLTPPASGELLTVKLHRLRQWLGRESVMTDSDIEGVGADGEQRSTDPQPPERVVRYRGRGERTETLPKSSFRDIQPGDALILPAGTQIPRILGHGDEYSSVDIHEQAIAMSGRPQTLRITDAVLSQWSSGRDDIDLQPLREWLHPEDGEAPDLDEWRDVRAQLLQLTPSGLHEPLNRLGDKPRMLSHPGNTGVVLSGPYFTEDEKKNKQSEIDPFAEEDDSFSLIGREVSLPSHTQQVAALTHRSAEWCVPAFAKILAKAAELHDIGKDEPRFQALLRNRMVPIVNGEPLAKSGRPGSSRDRLLREALGIKGFRHEMLSMQKTQADAPDAGDLMLHLIASHHGHARPFAPVFNDDIWSDPPPHHLGSGVAERFWKLTRRYGWWGLAYLEAILRLADHHTSRFPRGPESEDNDHD